ESGSRARIRKSESDIAAEGCRRDRSPQERAMLAETQRLVLPYFAPVALSKGACYVWPPSAESDAGSREKIRVLQLRDEVLQPRSSRSDLPQVRSESEESEVRGCASRRPAASAARGGHHGAAPRRQPGRVR